MSDGEPTYRLPPPPSRNVGARFNDDTLGGWDFLKEYARRSLARQRRLNRNRHATPKAQLEEAPHPDPLPGLRGGAPGENLCHPEGSPTPAAG